MEREWTIMYHSLVRPLEELPDTTFDELKEAVKKEEERRKSIRYEHAQELQKQIRELMQQIENEDFQVMYDEVKLDLSDIWVQY